MIIKFAKRSNFIIYIPSILFLFSAEKGNGSSSGSEKSRDTYEDAGHGSGESDSSSEESASAVPVESTLSLRHKLSKSASSTTSRQRLSSRASSSLRRKKSEGAESRKKFAGTAEGTGKMIREEEAETGRVNPRIYAKYFAATGYVLFSVFVILAVANSTFSVLNSFWLSAWSDDNAPNMMAQGTHLPVAVRLRFYKFLFPILYQKALQVKLRRY